MAHVRQTAKGLGQYLQELNVFLEQLVDKFCDRFAGLPGNAFESFANLAVHVDREL